MTNNIFFLTKALYLKINYKIQHDNYMKATELRLGNLVLNSSNETVTVREISETLVKTTPDNIHLISELKPIPLTEEILLKCGFEKRGVIFRINNGSSHQFDINYSPSRDIFYYDSSKYSIYMEVEIKYLHQLQNLYFALVGKELKI